MDASASRVPNTVGTWVCLYKAQSSRSELDADFLRRVIWLVTVTPVTVTDAVTRHRRRCPVPRATGLDATAQETENLLNEPYTRGYYFMQFRAVDQRTSAHI